MKNSKKTIAGIMAFACMLSLASCGENNNNSSNSQSGGSNSAVTAEKIADKSFKAIEIAGNISLNYIRSIKPVGDTGKVLITGNTDDGSAKIGRASCRERV